MGVTEGQLKVDVCHVTNVPAEGDGVVISIADPAWDALEAHGDKKIGEGVLGVTDHGNGTCHVSTAPIAVDAEVTTPQDTAVTTDVLANDIYVDPVTPATVDFPVNGTLGPWMGGTITNTPNTDFFGTDSFIYRITGIEGASDTATATITVGPYPLLPRKFQTVVSASIRWKSHHF
jgi:hypothetical protein